MQLGSDLYRQASGGAVSGQVTDVVADVASGDGHRPGSESRVAGLVVPVWAVAWRHAFAGRIGFVWVDEVVT